MRQLILVILVFHVSSVFARAEFDQELNLTCSELVNLLYTHDAKTTILRNFVDSHPDSKPHKDQIREIEKSKEVIQKIHDNYKLGYQQIVGIQGPFPFIDINELVEFGMKGICQIATNKDHKLSDILVEQAAGKLRGERAKERAFREMCWRSLEECREKLPDNNKTLDRDNIKNIKQIKDVLDQNDSSRANGVRQ